MWHTRILFVILFLLPCVIAFTADGLSRDIRRIIVTGTTLDIGIDAVIEKKNGIFTEREIEALGVAITDRYHSLGYTTSFVKQISIKEDGTLEFRVAESKITDVDIHGVSEEKAKRIKNTVIPYPDEIFNRFMLEKRIRLAKKELNLSRLAVSIENIENSADVRLMITAKESLPLSFRGGIIVEPIYGVTPSVEMIMPMGMVVMTAEAETGVREGEIKKIEGKFRVYAGPRNASWAIFTGYMGSRRIEVWESADIIFSNTVNSPVAGFRFHRKELLFEMAINYRIIYLEDYPGLDKNQSDIRMDVYSGYSNSRRLLNRHDSTEVAVNVSAGRSSIIDTYYQLGHVTCKTSFSPVVWLKIKPRISAYYTSSDSRYYWSYVFDGNLPGFYGDFTASKTKIIAGTAIEYEIIPEQFYCGPFINAGRYSDEDDKYKSASGAGISVMILFSTFSLKTHYAWDITRTPGDGGFFISLEGSF